MDITTQCGNVKGAVDAVTGKDEEMNSVALVELKVRRLTAEVENDMVALCCALDQKWEKYSIPRLKAPWTHGILVMLCQVSCSRSFPGRDLCRVLVWKRGSPPSLPVAKAKPQAKATAQPKALAAVAVPQQDLVEQNFKATMTAMQNHQGVALREDWVLLKEFLRLLNLPRGQATRDYLTGGSWWRLGAGKGRRLVEGTDWKYIKGKHGGGRGKGHPHVKKGVLKDILTKYYRYRQVWT